MKATGAIKRNPALISFSHEHHFELLLVWKIRQGIKKNISAKRISDYVKHIHLGTLEKHFKDEELLLFRILPEQDELRKRAVSEHAGIRSLLNRVAGTEVDYTILQELADTLEAHIRFEERILYNELQQQLSEKNLQSLSARTTAQNGSADEEWSDPFWNHK